MAELPMELLKEIRNEDIGSRNRKVKYELRKAARAVLFDGPKIALLFVSKHDYHKLPGGGIEQGESIRKALAREIMEETGCSAKIVDEVGCIVEYRDDYGLIHFSYCFVADVTKNHHKQFFTEKEKAHGFRLDWMSLKKAIRVMNNDKPDCYNGKFIVKRDAEFLRKVRKSLPQRTHNKRA